MDIEEDLSHLTLDVIGQSAFGYNFNTILGGDSKVSEAVAIVLQGLNFKYLICKFLIPFYEYLPLEEIKKIKAAREIADNTVIQVHEKYTLKIPMISPGLVFGRAYFWRGLLLEGVLHFKIMGWA